MDEVAKIVTGLGFTDVTLVSSKAEYSVVFLETIQKSLTDLDVGLDFLSQEGKL